MNIGIELVDFDPLTPNFSGFQMGGGALVCLWHAAVCPNFRVMSVPANDGGSAPTFQVGLALDLLRLVDVSLSNRSRR